MIREYRREDLPALSEIWNDSVKSGEVVFHPLSEEYFHTKFELNPNFDRRYVLTAEQNGKPAGFIIGMIKKQLLPGETFESSPGFIVAVFVRADSRRNGIGRALVNELEARFKADGKLSVSCGSCPVDLDWTIPGTPGHDHNNVPGVDEDCQGFTFLQHLGYKVAAQEVAMYLNLKDYKPWDGLEAKRKELLDQGIYVGRYDTSLGYDYDGMCDRVHSEYWRSVLKAEIECHKKGVPNTDVRFIPNGKVPKGPRPILVATCGNAIIAQTGPVDLQESGRGWFTGICTDPLFERRGVATVLFNTLMQEFIKEGAAFSTLFTGVQNHAQKIYLRTGFRVVRHFALLKKAL